MDDIFYNQVEMEIDAVEQSFQDGETTLKERNEQIREIELQARSEELESIDYL